MLRKTLVWLGLVEPRGPVLIDARRHALVFNALTRGLAAADVFVPLNAREAITRDITAALDADTGGAR